MEIVNPSLEFNKISLPKGFPGIAYRQELRVINGASVFQNIVSAYIVETDTDGLSVEIYTSNNSYLYVTGTPAAARTFPLTIVAINGDGECAVHTF